MGVCEFYFIFTKHTNSANKYNSSKGLTPYLWNWNGNPDTLYSDSDYGCLPSSKYGFYCTALIQYNDWQFPKDYPRKIRY